MSTNEDERDSAGKSPEKKPKPNDSASAGTSGRGIEPWWAVVAEVVAVVIGGLIDALGDD